MVISLNESSAGEARCPHTGEKLEPLHIPGMQPHESIPTFYATPQRDTIYKMDAHPADYGQGYFLEEYEKQYGRSYFSDEPFLRVYARRNLDLLRSTGVSLSGARLFEFGCATGFFLDEARRAGAEVSGVDMSPFGVRYATEMLGLPVEQTGFLEHSSQEPFDVVASFFSIEHIPDQALAFQKVASYLRPGGAFIFSLPSLSGPLFECHREKWARTHPDDHFVDYSPGGLKRILPKYGLALKKARPFSYHPERACGIRGSKWFRPLYKKFAQLRCYGDTITGVAIKQS